MTRKPTYLPEPRYWTSEQVAAYMGVSMTWLSENRPALAKLGMPQPDKAFAGRTDSAALKAWFDRRSGLIDAGAGAVDDDPFVARCAS